MAQKEPSAFGMASFLRRLWVHPGSAFRRLRENPGLWQGLFLLSLAVNLATFLLWMWKGPWAAHVLKHPLVLNGPVFEKAVPAALSEQRHQLWWNGMLGILLWLPLSTLIQGWIVWMVSQWLQKDPERTYDHGLAALLGSRVAFIPFAVLAASVVWHFGGVMGVPVSGMSIGFGLRVEVDTIPAATGFLPNRLWGLALLAVPWFTFSWLSARETLGLKGWRGVLVAALAL